MVTFYSFWPTCRTKRCRFHLSGQEISSFGITTRRHLWSNSRPDKKCWLFLERTIQASCSCLTFAGLQFASAVCKVCHSQAVDCDGIRWHARPWLTGADGSLHTDSAFQKQHSSESGIAQKHQLLHSDPRLQLQQLGKGSRVWGTLDSARRALK